MTAICREGEGVITAAWLSSPLEIKLCSSHCPHAGVPLVLLQLKRVERIPSCQETLQVKQEQGALYQRKKKIDVSFCSFSACPLQLELLQFISLATAQNHVCAEVRLLVL